MFGKIRNALSLDKDNIPAPALSRYNQTLMICFLLAIAGVLAAILMKSWAVLGFLSAMALLLCVYTYISMIDISRNGYKVIDGICADITVSRSINNARLHPTSYIIASGTKQYSLPYSPISPALAVGYGVRIYLYKGTNTDFEIGGTVRLGNIIGYEVTDTGILREDKAADEQ